MSIHPNPIQVCRGPPLIQNHPLDLPEPKQAPNTCALPLKQNLRCQPTIPQSSRHRTRVIPNFFKSKSLHIKTPDTKAHHMEPPITPAATTAAVGGEDSPNRISAAADHEQQQTAEDDDDSSSDFEFSFVSDSVPDITADELFSNGRILPVYPLFDRDLLSTPATDKPIRLPLRRLLIEEREAWSRSESTSSTSSSMDDLDGVPPETYCVWEPRSSPSSPTGWKKSSSTGSGSRRWRLRDLVRRSHSDGKEKFAFLSEAAPPAPEKTGNPSGAKVKEKAGNPSGAKVKGKGGKVTEMDIVTAHRLYYSKSGERRLPQQRDLVGGFFANMNGLSLSRAHHPF